MEGRLENGFCRSECLEDKCNGFGACVSYDTNEVLETFECFCDPWHTGQRCELIVPLPIVASSVSTVLTLSVLLFCWYSSQRFSKKKTYTAKEVHRFADYLNQSQMAEKQFLNEKHAKEDMENSLLKTMGNRIELYPSFETDAKQPSGKESKGRDDKKGGTSGKSAKKKLTEVNEEIDALGTDDVPREAIEASGAGGSREGGSAEFVQQPISLARVPSDQLVPIDAPSDVLKAAKKRRERDRQFEAEARKKRQEQAEKDAKAMKEHSAKGVSGSKDKTVGDSREKTKASGEDAKRSNEKTKASGENAKRSNEKTKRSNEKSKSKRRKSASPSKDQ